MIFEVTPGGWGRWMGVESEWFFVLDVRNSLPLRRPILDGGDPGETVKGGHIRHVSQTSDGGTTDRRKGSVGRPVRRRRTRYTIDKNCRRQHPWRGVETF